MADKYILIRLPKFPGQETALLAEDCTPRIAGRIRDRDIANSDGDYTASLYKLYKKAQQELPAYSKDNKYQRLRGK